MGFECSHAVLKLLIIRVASLEDDAKISLGGDELNPEEKGWAL
jgi:hypothetical protein